MLGWASQSKWPHLLRAISLLPPVCHLRWEGPGARRGRWRLPGEAVGMAGRARTARRQTVGQTLHERRLSVTHQVSDVSSLSHGVHKISAGQECQHVMKGLIHGGQQRRRSWSSSRYDPDWCWWGSFKMWAIIKCPCAIIKFLSHSDTYWLSPSRSLSLWPACIWYEWSSLLTELNFETELD